MAGYITIEVVPHSAQRYPTVGDWLYDESNNLDIWVSDLKNPKYNFLIGIHELIEATLCKARGIKEEDVTAFDVTYERNRPENDLSSEPGDDPKAPYYKEHQIATGVEKFLAQELGVNWEEYEQAVQGL